MVDARDTVRPGDRTRRPGRVRGVGEAGSVTAETALSLPAAILVLSVVLSVGRVVDVQIRCTDAARVAARAAARGESDARIHALAGLAAPRGAHVVVARSGELVTVRVEAVASLPLPGLPSMTVVGGAAAPSEPLSPP